MLLLCDIDPEKITVRDTGEPLVSLRDDPELLIDETRSQISNRSPYFCFVRRTLALKLAAARGRLPAGYAFLIKEGYRPAEVQRRAFESTVERYSALHPDKTEREIFAAVSQYVAPITVAGHPTGGAVDLTLAMNGVELFMGTAYNEEPAETGNRTFLAAEDIGEEAKAYRKILSDCLESVGFINYPSEWWHWSYGDSYWAYVHDTPTLFGPVEERDLEALQAGSTGT